MGFFQHGSTIILLADHRYSICAGIEGGQRIRAGQALLESPVGD